MIKTACFQWDTDVFTYLRSQMTASESSISYFLCFPSFSYSKDALHFYDAHKPTKVNKLFGENKQKY